MRLDEYLVRNGYTQAEFARRAGINRVTLSLILKRGGARASTALLIRDATGGIVTLEDIALSRGGGHKFKRGRPRKKKA